MGIGIVIHGSVVPSVPVTVPAAVPPALRTATPRSTSSPASGRPSASPCRPANESSSTTGGAAWSAAGAPATTFNVCRQGRALNAGPVSEHPPTESGWNGSVTLPDPSVSPLRYSWPGNHAVTRAPKQGGAGPPPPPAHPTPPP